MNWLQTHTGRAFTPLTPVARDIHLADITHALSNICRFTGHTRRFYSVAEHSCRVHDLVVSWGHRADRGLRRLALLHDAAEAYLVDLPRPVKRASGFEVYRRSEKALAAMIAERFDAGATLDEWRIVTAADDILLATEAQHLLGPTPKAWAPLPEPMAMAWHSRMGWSPMRSRFEFRRRWMVVR